MQTIIFLEYVLIIIIFLAFIILMIIWGRLLSCLCRPGMHSFLRKTFYSKYMVFSILQLHELWTGHIISPIKQVDNSGVKKVFKFYA